MLFSLIYLVFVASLLWGGSWLYLSWKLGTPLPSAVDVWGYYYPELRSSAALGADIRPDDDFLDVLMLGGSTIDPAFGDVEGLLKAGLQREFGGRVRIYNLARSAHTSRDSALKFSRLADKPFDLILIYDGFNDCRMNNCPPDRFRDDYTHCVWYHSFEKRRQAGVISLPQEMLETLRHPIGLNAPVENLVQFGSNLKTPGPFRRNLEEILNAAKPHTSLVLLPTFAYHIPVNYSDDKFRRMELDYGTRAGDNRFPLKMWGRPADVAKCVTAHNQIVRKLAELHSGQTVCVDQDRLMSHIGDYFVDGCHFTDEGCRKFVDNLLPPVIARLREKFAVSTKQ